MYPNYAKSLVSFGVEPSLEDYALFVFMRISGVHRDASGLWTIDFSRLINPGVATRVSGWNTSRRVEFKFFKLPKWKWIQLDMNYPFSKLSR